MNCLELRTAIMPVGMTADTFASWHVIYVEWHRSAGEGKWRVTDDERQRLHTITNEWTNATLPLLNSFKRREDAIKAARRYILTGHHGGSLWTDGKPKPEHLVSDILLHIAALDAQVPRPNSGLRHSLTELREHFEEKWGTRSPAYPEEYAKSHTLTVATGRRLAKNIRQNLSALAGLGEEDRTAQKLCNRLDGSMMADAFVMPVSTLHGRDVLPREYIADSKVSSVTGLLTSAQTALLIECYEAGLEAEHLALLPVFTDESVGALRQMLADDVSDEYIQAAFGN